MSQEHFPATGERSLVERLRSRAWEDRIEELERACVPAETRRIPQFIDVGTMYEICRSDNGEWTLRLKDGDDRVHVRDLNKHEKSFVDAALTAMGATDGGKQT